MKILDNLTKTEWLLLAILIVQIIHYADVSQYTTKWQIRLRRVRLRTFELMRNGEVHIANVINGIGEMIISGVKGLWNYNMNLNMRVLDFAKRIFHL